MRPYGFAKTRALLLLLLLFWGGPVQSLKRTKNWTRPVRFRTIMPLPLGIYTRVTNVTLLLDLAESWNLFPGGTEQSAWTSGACLGEPECRGLSAEWLQKQDIRLQHGGLNKGPVYARPNSTQNNKDFGVLYLLTFLAWISSSSGLRKDWTQWCFQPVCKKGNMNCSKEGHLLPPPIQTTFKCQQRKHTTYNCHWVKRETKTCSSFNPVTYVYMWTEHFLVFFLPLKRVSGKAGAGFDALRSVDKPRRFPVETAPIPIRTEPNPFILKLRETPFILHQFPVLNCTRSPFQTTSSALKLHFKNALMPLLNNTSSPLRLSHPWVFLNCTDSPFKLHQFPF